MDCRMAVYFRIFADPVFLERNFGHSDLAVLSGDGNRINGQVNGI